MSEPAKYEWEPSSSKQYRYMYLMYGTECRATVMNEGMWSDERGEYEHDEFEWYVHGVHSIYEITCKSSAAVMALGLELVEHPERCRELVAMIQQTFDWSE